MVRLGAGGVGGDENKGESLGDGARASALDNDLIGSAIIAGGNNNLSKVSGRTCQRVVGAA